MPKDRCVGRRAFLATAASGVLGSQLTSVQFRALDARHSDDVDMRSSSPAHAIRTAPSRLQPLHRMNAGVLDVAYHESGPPRGPVAMLMHGFPYDIHSYVDVVPLLATRGMRVIVPYLRGFAPTRFLDGATPRSGEQAALGADLVALMDALRIERAVVAGYDWGGRAASVVAALYPARCIGLVAVNSYLIQDIARSQEPLHPASEIPLWYQYYFHQERGRRGLERYRREIARALWTQWSPNWRFTDADFDRAADAFDGPDYVAVVIHSYRHRFGLVAGDPFYADVQRALDSRPTIAVPTITMDGTGDGVVPATDGTPTARQFVGPRSHRTVQGVGHNLPQEAPTDFANAVAELAGR